MSKFYATAAMRQRSQAFERIQESVLEREQATRNAQVVDFLGAYRQVIRAAIENSFVPNVRHEFVRLPRREAGRGNIPLLPVDVLANERFVLDRRLMYPTPQKAESRRLLDIAESAFNLSSRHVFRVQDLFPIVDGRLSTTRGRTRYIDSASSQGTLVGRPVIIMPVVDTYVTGHEFMHAVDLETWDLTGVDTRSQTDRSNLDVALETHAYASSYAFEAADGSTTRGDVLKASRDIWENGIGVRDRGEGSYEVLPHDAMPRLSAETVTRIGALGIVDL